MSDAKGSSVRAVARAIDILQSFSAQKPSMSVVEMQKHVRLSRPTLYRLLNTLVEKGLVVAEGDPQRFTLAHGVMQLAHVWMSGLDIAKVARPSLETLAETTGETAALFVLRGDLRLCVAEIKSRHVLSISRGIGQTEHISRGASGKAILAFLEAERLDAILATLPKGASRAPLLEQLVQARESRFAISRAEVFAGAVAIAAPVFDHAGLIAGSVGLFGPSARLNEDKIAAATIEVKAAAAAVSRELGSSGP